MYGNNIEFSSDGLKLRGMIFEPDTQGSCPAVVLLHGIPRSKPQPGDPGYLPLARDLAGMGFLTVFFNFRGAGQSHGNFHILGWSRDLNAMLDWLITNYGPERICLLGFSGGAAVAIYNAAQDFRISALVSVSSPAHFRTLVNEDQIEQWLKCFREIGLIREPDFPKSVPEWLKEFEEVSPIKWIEKISPRPILIIHGENDDTVPAKHAQMLFERANEPKEIFWVKNGQHRLRVDEHALKRAKDWLKSWKDNRGET